MLNAAFALALISPALSFAEGGGKVGGGDGIVCVQPGKPIQLLDYYEASYATQNLTIDLGPDTGNYLDRVNYVLNRYAMVDPLTAKRYRDRAQSFITEANFLPGDKMPSIPDFNESVSPGNGCIKEQFAVQNFDPKPNQPRYLVNQDLWNQADSGTKAGLILHESIYRDAHEFYGQTDSNNARYLNAEISSTLMQTISAGDYENLLRSANFDWRSEFSSKPKMNIPIMNGVPYELQSSVVLSIIIQTIERPGYVPANTRDVAVDSVLTLKSGQKVNIPARSEFKCEYPPYTQTQDYNQAKCGLTFYSTDVFGDQHPKATVPYKALGLSGNLIFGTGDFVIYGDGSARILSSDADQSILANGNKFPITKGSAFTLFHSGAPFEIFELAAPTQVKMQNGDFVATSVALFENGNVSGIKIKEDTVVSIQGRKVNVVSLGKPGAWDLGFYEDGKIDVAFVQGGTKLKGQNGKAIKIQKGNAHAVEFDENGLVISADTD